VIIRFKPGAEARVQQALQRRGGALLAHHASIDALTAVVDAAELRALADDDDVLSVSTDAVVRGHQLLGNI
jgi:hypothetical protein